MKNSDNSFELKKFDPTSAAASEQDLSIESVRGLMAVWAKQGLSEMAIEARLHALLHTESGRSSYFQLLSALHELGQRAAMQPSEVIAALVAEGWVPGEELDASMLRSALTKTAGQELAETVTEAWQSQLQATELNLDSLTHYQATLQPGEMIAQLAQAASGVATDAGTASAASAGAEAAAGAAAAGAVSSGALLAIVGGVALAAGSGGGGGGGDAPDTTAPAKITLSLASDTGVSATDGITSSAELTKTGLESGARLEYSLDGGNWSTTFNPEDGAHTVSVRQTDAAGLASEPSDALSFTLDTTAPVTGNVGMVVDRTAKTVTLNFGEDVDAGDLADAAVLNDYKTAFTVTTQIGGSATVNAVADIAIVDGQLVLTLTDAFQAGQVNLTYQKPASTAVLEDLAGNDVAGFFSGVVADGYIRGAQVWIDTDGDGVKDYNTGVVSNATGQFFLTLEDASKGAMVLVGGVNIDTGVPNTIALKAPKVEDFSKPLVINPLTTLVQSVLEQDQPAEGGTKLTAAQAAANVAKALGLAEGVDLLATDPLSQIEALKDDTSAEGLAAAASALVAQKAAAQIAVAVSLASANDDNALADATSAAVVKNLAKTVASGTVQASVADALSTALTEAANEDATLAAKVDTIKTDVATASAAIATAADLDSVSEKQAELLDKVAPAAPTVALAAQTNDTTPEVTLSLNTSNLDGSAVVVGDKVTLSVVKQGATEATTQEVTVIAADVAAGKLTTSLSGELAEGDYTITASVKDRAGNTGALAEKVNFTVDTTKPTVAVTSDVTSLGANQTALITFTFDEAVAAFSADAMAVENGKVESVERISDTTYQAVVVPDTGIDGQISVTLKDASVKDLAGNAAVVPATLAIAVDTLAPVKPTLSLLTDTNIGDDGITSVAELKVSKAADEQDDLKLEYSVDGGEWSTQAPTEDGTYTVSVRQTDASGNVSEASDPLTFTLDTSKPNALGVALVNDTGSSNKDSVTSDSDAALSVTGQETGAKLEYSSDAQEWSTTQPTATEGQNTVYVRQMDVAGNVSDAQSLTFTLDSTAPAQTISITGAEDDVPLDQVETLKSGATTNDNTPTLRGTLSEALAVGEVLQVFDGSNLLGSALVDGTGWKYEATLANGAHSFTARVVDAAGNAGTPSDAFEVTVDATVPKTLATITAAVDDVEPVAADLGTGTSSNDTALLLKGTTEALSEGDLVRVFDAGKSLGTATVDGTNWTFQTTELIEGVHQFTVAIENAGGNRGEASSEFAVTIDTTSPALPSWGVEGDDYFKTATPTINVTGIDAGAKPILVARNDQVDAGYDILVEGVDYSLTAGTEQGSFTLTVLKPLSEGDHGVLAMDEAGNVSPLPETDANFAFVIDTLAPQSPVIQEQSLRVSNDTKPTFTLDGGESGLKLVLGTKAADGSVVMVDSTKYQVTDNGDNSYVLSVSTALPDGDYGVLAVDAAGNKSVTPTDGKDPNTFRIDTVAPVLAATRAVVFDDGGDGKLDSGDHLILNFAEPVKIVASALEPHSVAAENADSYGFSTSYKLTLGGALSQTDELSLGAGLVSDTAGNTNVSALAIKIADAVPTFDLNAQFADILTGHDERSIPTYNVQEYDVTGGDAQLIFVEVDYSGDDIDRIGLSSVLLVEPVVGDVPTVTRLDLPSNVFTVDSDVTKVGFVFQELAVSTSAEKFDASTEVSTVSQEDINAVKVYQFDETELIAQIKAQAWAFTDPVESYDKAKLGNDLEADLADTIFVLDAWGPASAISDTLTGTALVAVAHSSDGSKTYFDLMGAGELPDRSMVLDGQIYHMSIRSGDLFVLLAQPDGNGGDLFSTYHLDIGAGLATPIDNATYWAVANSTDKLPVSVGTSGDDAALVAISDTGSFVYGFAGDDTLSGGGGDDTIVGGLGADSIDLGGGADVLQYASVAESSGDSIDTVTGFGADDALDVRALFAGYSSASMGSAANEYLVVSGVVTDPASGYSNVVLNFEYTGDGSVDYFSFNVAKTATIQLQSGSPVLHDEFWSQAVIDGVGSVFIDSNSDVAVMFASPATKNDPLTPDVNEGFLMSLKFMLPIDQQEFTLQMSDVELNLTDGTSIPLTLPDMKFDTSGLVGGSSNGVESGALIVVADGVTLADVIGDNELHWAQNTSTGVLQMQFDTDPSVDNTSLSNVMEIHGMTTALTTDQVWLLANEAYSVI